VTLQLIRESAGEQGTLGRLLVNGRFGFFTLEPDEDRANHPAIPVGTYRVVVTPSVRFKRMLPLVIGVPGRSGIRIHPGNVADDTDGCILLGMSQTDDSVQSSRAACELFQSAIAPALARDEPVTLTITEAKRTEAA
jgi:hypothetical protein